MAVAVAVVLTVLGVLTRLAPHPPNFVAMGAIALYAGARLPRAWAWVVPVAAMLGSDLLFDWGKPYSPLQGAYLTRYATFAVIVGMGFWVRRRESPIVLVGSSLIASTLFFLTTNWASWAFPVPGYEALYPRTIDGLYQSYVMGLPFFQNTIAADLLGTGLLFGADALARLAWLRRLAPQRVAELP